MFRLFFSHNPLPTWVFDCETLLCLQVNDAAVKQYGYSTAEFERMTILDFRPATEHAAFLEYIRQPGATRIRKTNWKHVRKDGKLIDAEVIAHRLEYAGRPVHLVVAQDIGERQHPRRTASPGAKNGSRRPPRRRRGARLQQSV